MNKIQTEEYELALKRPRKKIKSIAVKPWRRRSPDLILKLKDGRFALITINIKIV